MQSFWHDNKNSAISLNIKIRRSSTRGRTIPIAHGNKSLFGNQTPEESLPVVNRYASLYFLACVDDDDNELIVLETIHHFVEVCVHIMND